MQEKEPLFEQDMCVLGGAWERLEEEGKWCNYILILKIKNNIPRQINMHPSTYLSPHKDLFKFKITTDTDQKAICKQGPVTLRVTEIQVADPLTVNGYGLAMDPGQSRT